MHLRYPAAAVAAIVGLAFATGCKDTNLLLADQPVATDTLVAYALTGTSASLPSGLAVTVRSTVRVDGTGAFDVGFDIDSAGNIIVSPVRVLVNQLSGAPSVGIQTMFSTPFDSIKSAPGGYYRPDTAIVVKPGQPFVLLVNRTTASAVCVYDPSPTIYSKVVIDSALTKTTRAIYMRVTTDPNCGYRSFLPGLPTS
ncbi:MAG: hypothetical protein ABI338_03035 [Gemmatimonadaceae bacterium]